ncbi:hypothetical protein ASPSYDRAFT_224852 [Aspergillus sydowii CBS 593.65]|uniref:Ribosomal protein S11 n=1 Tax=Aspergillus sydowii CBS 593.65 TaxID=1036612 RepID=A0A1L9TVR9_9EURO|nr:uncharacterized protein ASPSYDRAFT_224852 [Aspergillus sydowii CBS 593.65]OJJ63383.1 hypothetical protein ASPSYDRAFT_224852 [Aspergillus sydowii CBS 593.65]
MNNTFAHALARALPSAGRQCQPRASLFRQARVFSTTPRVFESPDETPSALGREFQAARLEEAAQDNSPVSALTKMMRGSRAPVSADYSKMAQSLEAEMLKRPYSDHAPPHHLHVLSHRRNTILTLTRPNGSPLMSMGTGALGFRKARRGGYDPGLQLSAHVFAQIQERGLLLEIKSLEIIFRGFHLGRQAFVKALLGNEGRNIRGLVCRVSDSTRIKFGGARSPRVRRL